MGGIKVENANMAKLLMKRASILSSTLRNRTDDYKSDLLSQMTTTCSPLFEKDELKVVIDKTFMLSDVAEAHRYVESNKTIGKVVLINDL